MTQSNDILSVGIEDKLPWNQTILFAVQHLLALTGIWIFPVIIGASLNLTPEQTGMMVQACFFTTGIVTLLQSSRLLRLPIVQGPTAAFMVAVLASAHSVGLGTTFGSMMVAALIFACLSLPFKSFGIMGKLSHFISPPIVFGTLLVIIGAQLASIGPMGWFSTRSGGTLTTSLIASLVTVMTIIACMVLFKNHLIKRGALLWGIVVGVLTFYALTSWHLPNFSQVKVFNFPDFFAFGFGVSFPVVLLMMLAFLQASAEAMGMYGLVAGWGKQTLTTQRINRGLFTEFLGCAVGAAAGGLGTTSYPENVGIIRVSRVASRYVTLTAGGLALMLGLLPQVGLFFASLPEPVLSAASSILFGIIAISGIQMLAKVHWDELNLAVAAPAFILSLGSMYLPQSVLDVLPAEVKGLIAQPMMLGVILLMVLHVVINIWIREKVQATAQHTGEHIG
ncbi:uracil-xanthine permease family protein [Acinetobacter rathckeae]|uniref:uracil-xanthine permease family protein n=1 Tax=Acinetobacter rathckeae TaxID=2605272 RepID=UPI0018A30ACA|nr:solute carrier family 23 protein [Acinetobacter rathckeae]MBF7688323.1 purine/pyrimidine permease [Acinetobacter rathckeae]MBF7695158.1 purine/pyrimidine permease [Acinetobacter rathckeae]